MWQTTGINTDLKSLITHSVSSTNPQDLIRLQIGFCCTCRLEPPPLLLSGRENPLTHTCVTNLCVTNLCWEPLQASQCFGSVLQAWCKNPCCPSPESLQGCSTICSESFNYQNMSKPPNTASATGGERVPCAPKPLCVLKGCPLSDYHTKVGAPLLN